MIGDIYLIGLIDYISLINLASLSKSKYYKN